MTEMLFRDDPYLRSSEGTVTHISDDGGVVFDKTIFYPNSGGQAGDSGEITFSDGNKCLINTTRKTENGNILLVPEVDSKLPSVGDACWQKINWKKRYRHMRMHTALHLLSVVIPLPVTGGQITSEKGRLDFDMPDAPEDKQSIEDELNKLISGDYLITMSWISDDELLKNSNLVKTMSVKPPMGTGKVRLIRIGNDERQIDLQPCGGTHVNRTLEIGRMTVGKIEKKGKQNRRVSILFPS
jgi:misacylated tRNA(Ala) deacylase